MTKQEFLAASLPYGLKLQVFGQTRYEDYVTELECMSNSQAYFSLAWNNIDNSEYFKPIIRPLSDLTKECVQADYNNGKPFIPIVELAKMSSSNSKDGEVFDFNKPYQDGEYIIAECEFKHRFIFNGTSFWRQNGYGDIVIADNQLQLFQQLLKWHFDLITENCEKVLVTETFNPYK